MDIYDKSLEILRKIIGSESKYGYEIILIGGWAIWLYNPYMKSRDIDFIVQKSNLWKLKKFISSLGFRETSAVLQKHGFATVWNGDKIELDVYTEKIGKWAIEELVEDEVEIKNIHVLSPTKLFMLKAFTAVERRGTAKGEKDISDLVALLDAEYKKIDFKFLKAQIDLNEILSIIFSDFKTISKIYPIAIEKYKEIKAYMKEAGFL